MNRYCYISNWNTQSNAEWRFRFFWST